MCLYHIQLMLQMYLIFSSASPLLRKTENLLGRSQAILCKFSRIIKRQSLRMFRFLTNLVYLGQSTPFNTCTINLALLCIHFSLTNLLMINPDDRDIFSFTSYSVRLFV